MTDINGNLLSTGDLCIIAANNRLHKSVLYNGKFFFLDNNYFKSCKAYNAYKIINLSNKDQQIKEDLIKRINFEIDISKKKKTAAKVLIDPSLLKRGSYYITSSGQLTHYIGKGTAYIFSCSDLAAQDRFDIINNPFQFTLDDYKKLYTEINDVQKRSGYIFDDSLYNIAYYSYSYVDETLIHHPDTFALLRYINNDCIINRNLSPWDYNVLTYPRKLIKLYKQLSYNKSFFIWSFNHDIIVFNVQ